MSLKLWSLLLLVLVNVAVFLWPSKTNVAPHVYAQKAELNPHFVRLNKEIEQRFYTQSDDSIVLRSSDEVNDEAGVDASQNELPVSIPDGSICYRLGPFLHQASYELAQAVLFNANVRYRKSTRSSQTSDVYRLYLGEFETQAQVSDARLELKRKKVLDHFSRKLEDNKYIISLGIYSSQETAEKALALFSETLQGVKMQSETVTLPDSHWMHFVLPVASTKLEQLAEIEWGENSAKLGPHECKS